MHTEASLGLAANLLRNLGFPLLDVHPPLNHYDFKKSARLILVIGPMGSGKTEYSARIWRDSLVAQNKSDEVTLKTSVQGADLRKVFVVRSRLDGGRFPDFPADALAFRGGYVQCGNRIGQARNSFDLEDLLATHAGIGTWIIDEAAFYDERIAYLIKNTSVNRGLVFVCPTLVLNFRREIFNQTARLLLENATDIFPLSAYCEHRDCLADSLYTYRFYLVDGEECPAPYFDPLIIIGGDRIKNDGLEPNYCTRCDAHHYLPAKEYSYFNLRPLGEEAARGNVGPLRTELEKVASGAADSLLAKSLARQAESFAGNASATGIAGAAGPAGPAGRDEAHAVSARMLKLPCLAERELAYLFADQNLLSADQLKELVADLGLDRKYLGQRLHDNKRPIEL